MKRDIKTDNLLTEIVMGSQQVIHDLRKELRDQWRVPFMHREKTKYEKSKERAENEQWY